MLAKKCDLCRTYYDHYDGNEHNIEDANGILFIDRGLNDGYYKRRAYDIWPTCMSVVLNMLDVLRAICESEEKE